MATRGHLHNDGPASSTLWTNSTMRQPLRTVIDRTRDMTSQSLWKNYAFVGFVYIKQDIKKNQNI